MCVNEAWKKITTPFSAWKQCTPSLMQNKCTHPICWPPATSIKCSKQNATPSPYHAHGQISTNLKHVNQTNSPHPSALKLYIQEFNCFYFQENSLFITFIKNVWKWGMKKSTKCSKEIKCVSKRHETKIALTMFENNAPLPIFPNSPPPRKCSVPGFSMW